MFLAGVDWLNWKAPKSTPLKAAKLPSTTNAHHFYRLPVISIRGFIFRTYGNNGYGKASVACKEAD